MSNPTDLTTPVCSSCSATTPDVQLRADDSLSCFPCWQSALEHGHAHGLHTDAEVDPTDVVLNDCPHCPPVAERIRLRAVADAVAMCDLGCFGGCANCRPEEYR